MATPDPTERDDSAFVHTSIVLAEVAAERQHQDAKWGRDRDLPSGTGSWLQLPFYPHRAEVMAALAKRRTDRAAQASKTTLEQVLTEEYFEALAEDDPTQLRKELVQVAAVAVLWIETLDLRFPAANGTVAPVAATR